MLPVARAIGIGCGLWLWASSPGLWAQDEGKEAPGGSKAKRDEGDAKAKKASESNGSAAAKDLPAPTIKILDAGKDPKFPIRIKVEKGMTEELLMTMRMSMSIEMNGAALPPTTIPGQQMTIQTKVIDVAEDGDISYELVFTRVEIVEQEGVPAAQVEMTRSILQTMVGLKGTAVVSDRGITRRIELEKKEGLNPQVAQILQGMSSSIQSFSFPLPEEAVGTGARWEVKKQVEMQSIRLKQTSVYELALITGSLRKLKVTMEQSADEQKISPPGLPAGTQVNLQSMASKGAGEILLDLRRIVPRTSKIDVESESQMAIKVGEQEQQMRQKIKMAMEITGRESKDKGE